VRFDGMGPFYPTKALSFWFRGLRCREISQLTCELSQVPSFSGLLAPFIL